MTCSSYDHLSEIIPGLYQSGMFDFWPHLAQRGIRIVANMEMALDPDCAIRHEADGIIYLHYPMEDGPLPDIERLHWFAGGLATAVDKGWPVLSHCGAGLDRSGLVSALIVRRVLHITGEKAVRVVRANRPYALCNTNFSSWLETLDVG
jgi:protein-tyrosine phosphatase